MTTINPFLATDGYKTGHRQMYPTGTSLVYSNFTPRSNRHAPNNTKTVVSFGQQMVMKQIYDMFEEGFFKRKARTELEMLMENPYNSVSLDLYKQKMKLLRDEVCGEIKFEYSQYLGFDYDVSHIENLWNLGHLPIAVKALPEGTSVPIGVPVLTIYNTIPDFFWLTNFLETIISNLLWKPITSATIAREYKKTLVEYATLTDKDNVGFVEFQAHDFSMRGMDSVEAAMSSGLGHATSFLGSDTLPVLHGARKYYNENGFVIGSVNATEHSVMAASIGDIEEKLKNGELDDLTEEFSKNGGNANLKTVAEYATFKYLMKQFPTGILSVVSDTFDLWSVLTNVLPALKNDIMARDGKIVIRPDSGNPVDIICGKGVFQKKEEFEEFKFNGGEIDEDVFVPEFKGVVETLWDLFGGTINSQGYKVLDPHIGVIYGDSITLDRAKEICRRLEAKGFASTNVVLGIGSFTYQFNTRDTFGFAMKATYIEMMQKVDTAYEIKKNNIAEDEGYLGDAPDTYKLISRDIFKDPITDDGRKKSARGLLCVQKNRDTGEYVLLDGVSWAQENESELQYIFKDGDFFNQTTLTKIRELVKQ